MHPLVISLFVNVTNNFHFNKKLFVNVTNNFHFNKKKIKSESSFKK